MADLNVAVIGCGGIGGVHLARWSQVSGATVTAVCDVDAANAQRVAAEFGSEAYTDWKPLLEGKGLDIADVCTPPNLHATIATHALKNGLNVLCEKPLARTPDEARQIVAAAETSGKLLMTAFCHRFHPPVLFAKELIENDDLGRVIMFRNRFSGLFSGVEEKWFSNREISGGGALLDTAVHSIDLFRYLVGEVKSAKCHLKTFNPALKVDDSGAISLESEDGAIGTIEYSWATPNGRNVVEIYGTAGTCIIDYDSNHVRWLTADMSVWETKELAGDDRFQREICHFADAVRGNQRLIVTGHDGLRANEIIADLYAQA